MANTPSTQELAQEFLYKPAANLRTSKSKSAAEMQRLFEKSTGLTMGGQPAEDAPGYLGRSARIDAAIGNRTDLLSEVPQAAEEFTAPGQSTVGKVLNFGKTALTGLGGLSQRFEAGMSSPIRALQKGESPKEAAIAGLTGDQLTEFGDVAREAGVPEPVAATAGLVASSVVDPTKIGKLVNVVKSTGLVGAAKLTKLLGKKGAEGAMRVLQRQSPEVVEAAFADRFKFTGKKYTSQKGVDTIARNLAARTRQLLYRPANAAWNALESKAPNVPVKDADVLVQKLQALASESLGTEPELAKIASAARKIAGKDKVTETASSLVDAYGKPLSESSVRSIPTLKDVMNIQRTLRKSARTSVVDADAVRIINEHLTELYPEVAEANTLWAKWASVLKSQNEIVGKVEKLPGGKTIIRSPTGVQDFFKSTDVGHRTRAKILAIQNALQSTPGGEGVDLLTDVKRASIAQSFKEISPGLKGLVLQGSLGLGTGIATNPVLGAGVGAASMAASSPQAVAAAGNVAYRTQDIIRNVSNKVKQSPRARALLKLTGDAVDYGIGRQLTGRNE